MAVIWSQNFSADAAPGWESSGSFRVTGWRSTGASTLDADYPDVQLAEDMQVTVGTGPAGENVAEVFGGVDWGVGGIEFGRIGELSGGDMDTSQPIRISVDVYFDPVAMDTGYATGLAIYQRNTTSGYVNASPSVYFELFQVSGDTWGIELTAERWNSVDYNPTSYTFSRAATVSQWHTFELTFVHCTVNDYATNDVASDGLVRLKMDGTTIYELENSDLALWLFTADKVDYGRAASVAWGFYGLIGPATNFSYSNALSDGGGAPSGGPLSARLVYRQDRWRGYFDGYEDYPISCYPVRLGFQNYLDLRYDSALTTPVANTLLTDAHYNFSRYVTMTLP